MAKTITVYTTRTCPWCVRLKNFLQENNFPFTEKHVDEDYAAGQEMMKISGQAGVPFTVITDDNGQQRGILGFDEHSLKSALLG